MADSYTTPADVTRTRGPHGKSSTPIGQAVRAVHKTPEAQREGRGHAVESAGTGAPSEAEAAEDLRSAGGTQGLTGA